MAGLMTGLAIAGATAQLAGAGMSFADARKQKKAQAQAEREAEMAMTAARKSLELNYMDALSIQKEPYELERDASLVAGAQATEVLRESERGAGRIGSIYGQQQLAQRQISSAMGQEMFNLDYLSAQEDTRLRDIGTQIDLGEVTGAQLAAANSEERRAQQLQAGVQGIGNAAMTGIEGIDLYRKTGAPTTAKVDTTSIQGTNDPLANLKIAQQDFSTPKYNAGDVLGGIDQSRQDAMSRGYGSSPFRSTDPSNPFAYLGY